MRERGNVLLVILAAVLWMFALWLLLKAATAAFLLLSHGAENRPAHDLGYMWGKFVFNYLIGAGVLSALGYFSMQAGSKGL